MKNGTRNEKEPGPCERGAEEKKSGHLREKQLVIVMQPSAPTLHNVDGDEQDLRHYLQKKKRDRPIFATDGSASLGRHEVHHETREPTGRTAGFHLYIIYRYSTHPLDQIYPHPPNIFTFISDTSTYIWTYIKDFHIYPISRKLLLKYTKNFKLYQYIKYVKVYSPLISRWELDKFKNCWNKSFRTSKILTLSYQQFSNLSISQQDMSGPRLGALSKNRWSGVPVISGMSLFVRIYFWIIISFFLATGDGGIDKK